MKKGSQIEILTSEAAAIPQWIIWSEMLLSGIEMLQKA